MTKAILEMDLDTEEGRNDFSIYSKARELVGFIDDFENLLRSERKYGTPDDTPEHHAEYLWKRWFDLKGEHGLDTIR